MKQASRSAMSDSVTHGRCSLWNSPGHDSGVGSFLQGDLPDPGIEPRTPALLVDSLPSEPPGKPAAEARAPLLSPSRPGVLSWLREGSGPLGVGREFQTTEGLLRGRGCIWVWWTQERLSLRSGICRLSPWAAHGWPIRRPVPLQGY